jgi:hypothetical protein
LALWKLRAITIEVTVKDSKPGDIRIMIKNSVGIFCAFALIFNSAFAAEQPEAWKLQVQQADAVWWEVAFNHCDEKKMTDMLSDDMEFVHDEIGIYQGKKAFVELTMQNVCKYSDMRREAVAGTVTYDPLRNARDNNKIYGVIVSGEHVFYEVNRGVAEKKVSRGRFTNVMLFDGVSWKLSRALSYGHQAIASDKK